MQVQHYLALFQVAKPGEIVEVASPIAINVVVSLTPEKSHQWPKKLSLVKDQVVVPIGISTKPSKVDVYINSVWKEVSCDQFAVELGFCMTFQKTQGRTLQQLILDLNQRTFNPKITFNMLLVGLSRVRSGTDFRILPLQPGSSLGYLQDLTPDLDLLQWLAGFNSEGVWSTQLAETAKLQW